MTLKEYLNKDRMDYYPFFKRIYLGLAFERGAVLDT